MTTTSTTQLATDRPATPATAPRGSARTVALAVVAALAGAGITAGLVLGLGSTPAAPASDQVSTWTAPATVVPSGGSSGHHVAPKPPAPPAPSAAVETLQRELGQLNYYEGPITGTMTTQTVQAIDYPQRDAHLPQTGVMNAQTQAALANFLAHGNNQMGS